MKTLSGFALMAVAATGLIAQQRTGIVAPRHITRNIGSVVQPGATSGMPGVQRTTGSILFPGGGTPQIAVPGAQFFGRNPNVGSFGRRHSGAIWAYPVYVGGGYYPEPAPAQEPNVVVVYPPPAAPVIINHYGYGPGQQTMSSEGPSTRIFDLPGRQPAAAETSVEPEYFLIAFQDKNIYSAVNYWVEGDTLHYFTAGNTHNQASVGLVDRELTAKLNKESGREVKLPPIR